MYRVSPLTYFLEGLAIARISEKSVSCAAIEMLPTELPVDAGSCGEYSEAYMRTACGYIANTGDTSGTCQYRPISDANSVLRSLGMGVDRGRAWRDVGVMAAYILFNTVAIFVIYWLVRVRRRITRATRQ